jgi:hypothetical protein
MEVAEREVQVRRFVDEVWNGRNYEAAADLYSEKYINTFGTGPAARIEPTAATTMLFLIPTSTSKS